MLCRITLGTGHRPCWGLPRPFKSGPRALTLVPGRFRSSGVAPEKSAADFLNVQSSVNRLQQRKNEAYALTKFIVEACTEWAFLQVAEACTDVLQKSAFRTFS